MFVGLFSEPINCISSMRLKNTYVIDITKPNLEFHSERLLGLDVRLNWKKCKELKAWVVNVRKTIKSFLNFYCNCRRFKQWSYFLLNFRNGVSSERSVRPIFEKKDILGVIVPWVKCNFTERITNYEFSVRLWRANSTTLEILDPVFAPWTLTHSIKLASPFQSPVHTSPIFFCVKNFLFCFCPCW